MEGDIKGEMSSEAPEQSPLDRAKAEANELIQKFQDDLDSIRTAPLNELETRMNSLRDSFRASQESAILNVENALKSSDTRIDDLERNLQAASERITNFKIELASQRVNYVSTKSDLQKAKSELEEAKRRAADLQNDHRAVQQRNVGLQAELELAKQQPANLEERLKAVEQQNAALETDLRSATQRASTAENGLKAFRSRFKQITDDMTALVSSSEQQLTVAQPVSKSAPTLTRQGSADEGRDAPQQNDHLVQTQRINSCVRDPTSNKNFDYFDLIQILGRVMHKDNWPCNRYFLNPMDSSTQDALKCRQANLGPINLGTMKDKACSWGYVSTASFQADFDLMIADCKKLNPPDSLVCKAADELVKIFERAWSSQRTYSEKSRGRVIQDPKSSTHKRKASTERPGSSGGDRMAKKPRECTSFNHDAVRPASPATDKGVHHASSQSRQVPSSSRISAGVDTSVWQGPVTTGRSISISPVFDAVAKRVSAVKPGNTCSSWKSLLPYDLHVTAHALPDTVEDELFALNFDLTGDMITLRLEPATGSDTSAFDRLFDYLVSRERYATVSYQRNDHVRKIYLVPTLPKTRYPDFIPGLDHAMLPTVQTTNVMLMIIVHHVLPENREPVRKAWNHIVQAVNSPDMSDLAGMRDHLIHHPLPVYFPRIAAVFGGELYIDQMLKKLSQPQENGGAKLADFPRSLLRLSYRELDQSGPAVIDGVQLPEAVFILGAVVSDTGKCYELLVVDIQNGNRSLWAISKHIYPPLGATMTLLRSKFPKSWHEWEDVMVNDLRDAQLKKQLKDTGLQIERF